MPKERNFNPVQAQRKADKAKAIKKGKAEAVARRNEKLAQRNPERIQKQIEDLKAITAGGGTLTKHEEQVLEGLERDLKSVNKAREALGDKAPSFGRGPPRDKDGRVAVLGKRRRDVEDASSSDEDIPEDVKNIPMPRDTPPPIPKEILDGWYARRRARRDANQEPLGKRSEPEDKAAPAIEARAVYEAKPIIRDLRKEAVSAFVPAAVRAKIGKSKGEGGLMEPEEADKLEAEGYIKPSKDADESLHPHVDSRRETASRHVTLEEVEDEDG